MWSGKQPQLSGIGITSGWAAGGPGHGAATSASGMRRGQQGRYRGQECNAVRQQPEWTQQQQRMKQREERGRRGVHALLLTGCHLPAQGQGVADKNRPRRGTGRKWRQTNWVETDFVGCGLATTKQRAVQHEQGGAAWLQKAHTREAALACWDAKNCYGSRLGVRREQGGHTQRERHGGQKKGTSS